MADTETTEPKTVIEALMQLNGQFGGDGTEEPETVIEAIQMLGSQIGDEGGMVQYVEDVLEDHPEWTTTVVDGAISTPKLADSGVTYPKLASDVKSRLANKLVGELSGTTVTASDAYPVPPVALGVDGKSVQDGTPTPSDPVEIESVESVVVHVSADGETDATGWPLTIPLSTYSLRSLPDGTHDELLVDADGNVTLVQRVGVTELTTIAMDTGNAYTEYGNNARSSVVMPSFRPLTNSESRTYCYCDKLIIGTYPTTAPQSTPYSGCMYSTYFFVVVPKADLSTQNWQGMQAWLQANKPKVYYPLATPVTHDLGTVTLPALPAPDLTAWASTDPTTTLHLAYERDATAADAQQSTAITQLGATYGTCSTASSTAAKVVECAGFALRKGARIVVAFSTANTVAAPTLNVNGTGAIAVWYHGYVASSSNPVLFAADAQLPFVYDGSHWVLDVEPPSYTCSCSTAESTKNKAASRSGALVVTGTTVAVVFSTANVYTSDSIGFNLAQTGVANIYRDGEVTSSSNTLTWSENTVLMLVRSGTAWHLADSGTRTMSENALFNIAPTESTTATADHSAGELLLVGGKLVKVTDAITTGDTITIGTNVAATTLAAEIAALA